MTVRDGDVPEATSALIAGATLSAATLPVLGNLLGTLRNLLAPRSAV